MNRIQHGASSLKANGLALALLVIGFTDSAAAADLFGPYPGDMIRYEMPNYTLVAVGNLQIRRDFAKLPSVNRTLELSTGLTAKPTGVPTRVYLVSASIWSRYLKPGTPIISEFVATRFVNYVIGDASRFSRDGLFHEYSHLFLHTQLPGVIPLWFDEGLAEMMAEADFSGSKVRFLPSRRSAIGGWIATDRVLRASKGSPEYLENAQTGSFHSQSRAMMHRALVDQPEFGKKVFNYLDGLNNLQSVDDAARQFGVSIDRLDSQMRAYVDSSFKHYATLSIGTVADEPLTAGESVSKRDALVEIANVMIEADMNLDRVHDLLDVAAEFPGGADSVRAPRMKLAARRMDDAELSRLYQLVAADLDSDVELARGAGLAMFDRVLTLGERPASADQSRFFMSKAFELLNRSLHKNADDPEAVFAYATLAVGLNRDLDGALQWLAPMFVRMPRHPDMAAAAARLLQARGDVNLRPYLLAVYKYSHAPDQRSWAATQIKALEPPTGTAVGTNTPLPCVRRS